MNLYFQKLEPEDNTMFSTGGWKQKAGLMALGSIFTIIGMLFAIGMLPSVTAQRDKFDTIQCSRLVVVNAAGINEVILDGNEHGGAVVVSGKDGEPMVGLGITEHGGQANVFGKGGKSEVWLSINEHGGSVIVVDKDRRSGASLSVTERGGRVGVSGKDDKSGAVLDFTEHGSIVVVW